jgi:hypothetical protein
LNALGFNRLWAFRFSRVSGSYQERIVVWDGL